MARMNRLEYHSRGMKSPLFEKIMDRVRVKPITFAGFMEAALYDPDYGYYASGKSRIGPGGDYITSPSMSPVFGKTLARLAMKLDEILDYPDPFTILEPGAGSGRTAAEILDTIQKRSPELRKRIRYIALEKSDRQVSVLKQNLAGTPGFEVARDLMPVGAVTGMIFSNEFFDALPVHRLVMRDKIKEIYVAEKDGYWVDVEGEASDLRLVKWFEGGARLLEGQFADVSLDWVNWMDLLAGKLDRGAMITIDYGYPAHELFSHIRYRGTLLAYKGHNLSEDIYTDPGEQDITAHVDFTALSDAGCRAGLETVAFTDQLRLFLALGVHEVFAELEAESSDLTEYQVALQPAKALIMPGGMGETFKVLAQHRGLGDKTGLLLKLIPPKYALRP